MRSAAERFAKLALGRTPLGLWPMRVRGGVAAGARWTLYPWTSYWRGAHEPLMQAALISLGGGDIRSWSCWDLGAHFGLYSVGLARRVGHTGQVAAFEPNPASFDRLQRHARMNGLDWLKCYPAAVSDHADGAELYTYGDLGTTTTHLPYRNEPRPSGQGGAVTIATLRLDDLVKRGELRPPQFVKIDVEGHGGPALNGMRETLTAHRPIVIAAFHSPEEIEGMMALLRPLGYRWREVAEQREAGEPRVGADYLFTPAK